MEPIKKAPAEIPPELKYLGKITIFHQNCVKEESVSTITSDIG